MVSRADLQTLTTDDPGNPGRSSAAVAISATFTAESIEEPLSFWLRELRLDYSIVFAPYNQVFQSLLDPASVLATNRGINVVLLRWQDLGASDGFESNVDSLIEALQSAAARSPQPLLVMVCPASPDLADDSRFREAETKLTDAVANLATVKLLTPSLYERWYPMAGTYDATSDRIGHIPYTPAAFAALATTIARRIDGLNRPPFKVIVLDCDNTLWRGILGEDGVEGIATGPEYQALHRLMIAQHDAGMLLTICSKNNEADVEEAFRLRPDMPLRREHFVTWRINWDPKSANIRDLARELDLGLDSFIFIDDSPTECAEVQAGCPEVLTLQLPDQPEQIPAFLDHIWAFDQWQVTADDRNRTEVYKQKLEREQVEKQATNIADFIASLQLQIEMHAMLPAELARVAQLTQRTSQFNCTTIRRTEADVQALLKDGYDCLTVDVSDRFGRYGLIGVVMYRGAGDALEVDSFLLSCRALGRGVEYHIIRHLGEVAVSRGLARVSIPFRATPKNAPARLFLESIAGDYKHEVEDGFTLELPAAFAAEVSYRPTDAVVIVPESPKKAAGDAPGHFRNYYRLASELRTPAMVVDKIRESRPGRALRVGSDFRYRNQNERNLAAIWADVLGYEEVGRDANFFDLGGHSLLAVRLLSRIYKDNPGCRLTLTALLQAPTVAQFQELLEAEPQGRERERIERQPAGSPSVVSIGQEGLWYVQQLEPESPFYSIPIAIRLKGDLDIETVQRAVEAVAVRQQTLRTTLNSGPDGPSITLHDPQPVSLEAIDLRNEDDPQAALERRVKAEVRKPFRLEEEGFRVALFRTADQDHTLLFNINHVFADGWSLGVWRRDFARYYEAFITATTPQLEDLPIQYTDFAAWEREWLNGAAAQGQLQYWEQQLNDSQQALALPTDRPRPPRVSYRGDMEPINLSTGLVDKLTELAGGNGATLFMALLAGWYALLHRYSGQEDILTGSPIANRSKPEVEGLVGLFMNMLVLRADLSGEPSFRDLISRVRSSTLQAYENHEYPFEKLVEKLKPERDPSRTAFYQNILILQTAATDAVHIPGLEVSWQEVHTGTAKTDLTLALEPVGGGLQGFLEYNTDLFEAATIRRMLDHYEVLLRNAVADPDRPITRLDLLTPGERQHVLVDWNRTQTGYPRDLCAHQLIERQAARTPDRVAAVDGKQRLTYAELNRRANQLAHWLRKQGAGPDVPVGVQMERSVDMLVVLLGVLKAGSAYVPLDPIYPPERRAYMVDDSGLRVVVTDEYLRDNRATLETEPANDCVSGVQPENLAYVIYTSGSTGKPKGVEIPHRALTNFLCSFQRTPGLVEDDVLLAVTTISFDIAGLEMYLPLTTGAQVVVADREAVLDPKELARLMNDHDVTVLQATPATWQMLINDGWRGKPDLKILCGGEALPRELATRLLSLGREVWNVYGPTETTIWSLVERITDVDGPILIGRPIANTDVFVLDKAGQPVPVGVSGELLIGGDGVARGYHHRPELTAEKFIPNPFASDSGARLYKTGDLARYYPDGRIECQGRVDFQVKIRGFRIELGEIESVLAQRPDVARNVVVVREDSPGNKRIVAYVIPAAGAVFDSGAARQHLREVLPDYMVPSDFVVVEAFPLTPNKKVDRRALPAPAYSSSPLDTGYVPPRTPVEETLCQIWAEILRVPRVGIHDNFFDLGGHSLLAVRLLARILEKWPYQQLTIAVFLQAPTVAELAAILQSGKRVSTAYLFPYRKSGTRPPFFFVPGAGGNVVSLRSLATTLSENQPLYCLQAKGLDGSEPFRTVEEAAAFSLEQIRQVQPQGPYYLGGGCFGGLIAFEMAQMLRRQGEEVGPLTLIDTYNFAYGRTLTKPRLLWENVRFFGRRIGHHLRNLRKVPWADRMGYLAGRTKAVRHYLSDFLAVARGKRRNQLPFGGIPAQLGEDAGVMQEALNRVTEASMEAARSYVPQPYPGDVLLFKASDRVVEPYQEKALGWGPFAPHIEINEVEGDHLNITDIPRVANITQRIEVAIEQHARHASAAVGRSAISV